MEAYEAEQRTAAAAAAAIPAMAEGVPGNALSASSVSNEAR
jgi:hypothetical protein